MNSSVTSKFKIGDKVRCAEADQGQWIEVGEIYTVKCVNCEYIHLEEITEKHDYHESRFELVSEKTKLNYREMKPTDMVKVCIGDSEFEVHLGDLVHTTALLGASNRFYGFELWECLVTALGKDGFTQENLGSLIELRDQEKKDIDYFFQPSYEKQKQKEELSNLILSKQEELSQLIEKLNQM